MNLGRFYFLSPQYFLDFPNQNLMSNHSEHNNKPHNRPCFYAFTNDNFIYWVIPISSKVQKFEDLYSKKKEKYGRCDTIDFCDVLGRRRAFLIQNMCPITQKYILNEYIDPIQGSVAIDSISETRIISKAKKVLALQRKGCKLIFGNVLDIEKRLVKMEEELSCFRI